MLNKKRLNFIKLKEKKREYYRKSRESKGHIVKEKQDIDTIYSDIDYEKELSKDNILETLKDIAHKQNDYMITREEKIRKKIKEYREEKKKYYHQNKKDSKENS